MADRTEVAITSQLSLVAELRRGTSFDRIVRLLVELLFRENYTTIIEREVLLKRGATEDDIDTANISSIEYQLRPLNYARMCAVSLLSDGILKGYIEDEESRAAHDNQYDEVSIDASFWLSEGIEFTERSSDGELFVYMPKMAKIDQSMRRLLEREGSANLELRIAEVLIKGSLETIIEAAEGFLSERIFDNFTYNAPTVHNWFEFIAVGWRYLYAQNLIEPGIKVKKAAIVSHIQNYAISNGWKEPTQSALYDIVGHIFSQSANKNNIMAGNMPVIFEKFRR